MSNLTRRAAWNVRHRWRRLFALIVIGAGVIAPLLTGVWWSLPLVWFIGLFILLPVFHTLAKPLPEPDDGSDRVRTSDPALDALRTRYARGNITDAEFERRLDQLLETEDAEVDSANRDGVEGVGDRVRENVRREIERIRE